ncbi:S4 domain-containing protein [Clostridium perfringens D]|nr:S4 domain-containing protein [Clostridium perfringens]WEV14289.1 S4 domain-containing protein [Clostridium perfringens D]
MRINKLFSNFGICSRKETNKIIREGRVIVNGKPCIEGQWVELSDEILLDGKPLVPKEKIYIALNKPVGVVCTAAEEVKDNIIDYLGIDDYVFPIGRLDKDSQGLNRQIRRMSKVFGFNVVKLERIRILNITLEDIEYGKWRYINREEIEILKKLIK